MGGDAVITQLNSCNLWLCLRNCVEAKILFFLNLQHDIFGTQNNMHLSVFANRIMKELFLFIYRKNWF